MQDRTQGHVPIFLLLYQVTEKDSECVCGINEKPHAVNISISAERSLLHSVYECEHIHQYLHLSLKYALQMVEPSGLF